jgi:hypothetical protein
MTKSTVETNKSFTKANAARKRVLIAKDVLIQIEQGKYNMTQGEYFRPQVYEYDALINQQTINEMPPCKVCGIGAAFCSALRLGNDFSKRAGSVDSTVMREEMLYRYFEPAQVDAIEYAFEGWSGLPHCQPFYYKFKDYSNKNAVAEAIFRNIIKNKGVFKPETDLI